MCLPGTVEAVREGARDGVGPAVSRRTALLGGGAAAATLLLPEGARAHRRRPRRRGRVADLTHVFREGFPVYGGDPPSRRTLVTVDRDGFYAQAWSFGEHSGTHMDAPGHFVEGARLVDELEPRELVAPAVVLDISERAEKDPDAAVRPSDVRRHERRHGRIPKGAVVFMNSGWDERAGDPARFKNRDAGGTYHFPGFGLEAVELLLERRIAGIGVDTLSLDIGPSTTFDVHRRLLGADRYGLEGVANLGSIPRHGARVTVGVVPWQRGSGGPCRLIATY